MTRYKKQPREVADLIRDAVLGVTVGKKREAEPAEPAAPAAAASPAALPPMKIDPAMAARVRSRRARQQHQQAMGRGAVNPFQPYAPAPGVLPEGATPTLAMDSSLQTWATDTFSSAWGMSNSFGSAFAEGIGFLGYAYLSELTQRPEYRRMGERISTEMTRKWIRLTIASDDEEDDSDEDGRDKLGQDRAPAKASLVAERTPQEEAEEAELEEQRPKPKPPEPASPEQKRRERKLRKINERMKELDVRGRFRNVAEYDCWMGRSHLYIDTGAGGDPAELLTDLGDGSNDVSKAKFKKGSFKALKHVEPIWCYPVRYNATDPLSDDWYRPDVWFAMAKQIHRSRLLTFVGREVPDLLKPAYAFGGLSLSQMAKPYVDNWLRTRQAVADLVESFSVSGVYTNAQSLLQGEGEEVINRIELFAETRQNMGSMVLDKESEEFFNISTPLGTLDALQAQSQEQMSSVSGIPLVVLLGITPTGLNASSDGEIRVFYDLINAMQESLWRAKLQCVINFVQLDVYGEVDPAIGFEFEPLWSLDEKALAEVRKIEMETHTGYVDLGVVGQDEVRTILVADESSPYNGLKVEDLPDLEQEQEEGLVIRGATASQGGGEGSDDDGGGAIDAVIPFAGDSWSEADHPRGQPENAGQFGPGGGGGGSQEATPARKPKKAKTEYGGLYKRTGKGERADHEATVGSVLSKPPARGVNYRDMLKRLIKDAPAIGDIDAVKPLQQHLAAAYMNAGAELRSRAAISASPEEAAKLDAMASKAEDKAFEVGYEPPSQTSHPNWSRDYGASAQLAKFRERSRASLVDRGKREGLEDIEGFDLKTGQPVTEGLAANRQRYQVEFSPKMLAILEDPRSSFELHHNHPSDTSLSGPDLEMLAKMPGLARVYAHGHAGGTYSASGAKPGVSVSNRAAQEAAYPVLTPLVSVDPSVRSRLLSHAALTALDRSGEVSGYRANLAPEVTSALREHKALFDKMVASGVGAISSSLKSRGKAT